MKTFQQFILEAYDPEVEGRSQIRTQGQGGRVGADRKKTEPEKRRVKAVGGGKTAPAADYKPRRNWIYFFCCSATVQTDSSDIIFTRSSP